ncbi:hypothetical protein pdam_00000748 [Pocillopora damicornis]|uniref:Condensin complex subunit 1 C-terminal domain-containing protein n=1 Tax=Pocillopora damicornis TaxID=46731 RepID=A0A3M6TV88_POCDA|nr:hypothetical protein pdam_00000748 [Pocillopora damicornis]
MALSKTEKTITACSNLQISSISREWAEDAWNSEFCESQGFPEVMENCMIDRGYFVRELKELLLISKQWTTSVSQDALNEGLWKVLSDNNFSHKVLISLLHSFIESCDKTSNAGPKLESCVLAANIYGVEHTKFSILYYSRKLWMCCVFGLTEDAVVLLNSYSLKDSEQVAHHVIQLFVETTRQDVETIEQVVFDFPGDQIYSIKSIASLAYFGLRVICSPLHGDVGTITHTVFEHLISNVLMVFGGAIASNGTISRNVQNIKDQAVAFICYLARKETKEVLCSVEVLVQNIFTSCPERAEYRITVAKAVVDIMKILPVNQYASLIEWIDMYSKNDKISYRIFALDVFSLLLVEPERILPDENLQDDDKKKLLCKKYLLDIIIARCSDRAPMVRAKALQYFAQCATLENSALVLRVKEALHEPLESPAEGTPTLNRQANSKQTETRNIGVIIRKRTRDEKVGVRKAALQALESVITLNLDSLERVDVLTLHDCCMDPALSVRRQAMVSLTSLLQERPKCTMVHSLWLEGVLPLVMDRETTAQEKCFQILEEVLLHNIVPLSKRYLHSAFQHWSKQTQNKLSGNLVKSLISHIDTEHSKAAWLCLAAIGSSSNKLDHTFVVKSWDEYSKGVKDYDIETLCRILAVLGSSASFLPSTVTSTLTADLQRKLITFECPPEVIDAIVATLCKLNKGKLPEERGKSDHWCSDLLKASEEFLSSVTLKQDCIDEERLMRHLFTVGAVAQLTPTKTTERLFMFVESMLISHGNNQDPLQKLNLSPPVKAHVFVTLGKLCLQNEDLAKQCIATLARELETSDDPAIRNNVTVVMCDLCVRFTSLVDRYVPNIAVCLKDSSSLVRRQTLTVLTHLLQEDFVKWKGALFYRFITTIVDEDVEIRKFAEFCLVHLLLSRHPGMLFQHFVECVFHFNSFEKHQVYNKFPQTDTEKKLFSLKGYQNSGKRYTIYQFMLSHMSDEGRFNLTGKLCQEVLGGFTDGDITLDSDSASVLKDALLILSSKNIKLSSMKAKAAEDLADEGDVAGAAIVEARNKFLTQVLKKNMIENIIPIIIELKHMVNTRQPGSDGNTPQAADFIAPQLRSATPSPKNGSNRPNITPLTGAINQLQINRRHTLASNPSLINNALKSNLTVQISPLQAKRRYTLSTAAILNSARKAVDQAHKVAEQQKRRSISSMGSPHENSEQSHLSRISFCVNTSATAPPPSPIPTSLPIRVYAQGKVAPPSWIEGKVDEGNDGDEEEKEQQIICLMSPEQKPPKPRTWNIKSPDTKKLASNNKAVREPQNDSVSRRTRSRRRK